MWQDLFAFAIGMGSAAREGGEACLIIGFLCFLVSVILGLGYTHVDEMSNKIAEICFIIFTLIAGQFETFY